MQLTDPAERSGKSTSLDLSAFILAGGKSSRMGRDKALLQLDGKSLLERSLELAHHLTSKVRIVGDPAKFAAFGATIEDIYPDRGPLAAIHSALMSTGTSLNLVLAVDLPFLQPDFCRYLAAVSRTSGAMVTVPRTGEHFHPLCAIYRRQFAATAERALAEGNNKIGRLFAEVQTRVLDQDELVQNGFSVEMFINLNRPEEWADAELRYSQRVGK